MTDSEQTFMDMLAAADDFALGGEPLGFTGFRVIADASHALNDYRSDRSQTKARQDWTEANDAFVRDIDGCLLMIELCDLLRIEEL